MNGTRLQKYLADCGVASRRKAEELILSGVITVNKVKITELGTKVFDGDVVKVKGKIVRPVHRKVYIMLYKPVDVVTTSMDTHDRKTVVDIINQDLNLRVFPVGRLDKDTQGLLILTNDGDLSYGLTHPSFLVDKTYIASLSSNLTPSQTKALEKGVVVDEKKTAPAKIRLYRDYGDRSDIEITVHEGRNRQVRKMFEAVGCKVKALSRIKFAGLSLGHLAYGRWRHLSVNEVNHLKRLVGLDVNN